MLIDLLVDVASLLETLGVEKTSVTTGSPPAPAGECESAIWVWGGSIYHSREPLGRASPDADCFYRRTYEIRYRIDVCLPINHDGSDLTTAQWLSVSETLYDLSDEAWCALTDGASAGTLFQTIDACEDIHIGELVFEDPQGGIVSAEGSLAVTDPCEAGS